MTPLSDRPADAPVARTSHRRLGFVALSVFAAAALAMWGYALFFATGRSPDKVPDRGWAARAQSICTSARADIDALPAAETFRKVEPRAEALRQRVAVLDRANEILGSELAALRALPTADPTTSRLTGQWLTDWDTYLGDRRTHADELRAGKAVPFSETTYKDSPISNRMDAFARVNLMPRCGTPFDLA